MNPYSVRLVAAVALLLPGCTTLTILRTEELRQVGAHVDSLAGRVDDQSAKLIRQQKEQTEILRSMRADLQVRLGQLDQRLTSLETALSESQSRLLTIDRKTREIHDQWEGRARVDSAGRGASSSEAEEFFQIAYGDFTAGRFDLALNGFTDIVNRYPGTPQEQLGVYWKAEVAYARKEWDQAQSRYVDYIKRYPEGEKICPALYKLGLVYENLDRNKSRNLVWEKLLSQCPGSQEAKAAQNRL